MGSTVVVGGGIAGLACARAVQQAGREVVVLDRGHAVGGRMGGRTLHGRPVDLGASYFTAEEGSPFAAVVADWARRGLVHPWTDTFATADASGLTGRKTGPVRYGARAGLRSLVADLADGVPVQLERSVATVTATTVDGDPADAVALALPDPQAVRLLDDATASRLALDPGGWQPALAVALGWSQRRWLADLHGVFVAEHPVLEWLADDGARRGDGAPVLVAHTTPAFARAHLDDPEQALPAVRAAVTALLGIDDEPAWGHVHRWSFAKPGHPRDQPFGLVDGVGVCGDGWSAPAKVGSAWTSGDALGRALVV